MNFLLSFPSPQEFDTIYQADNGSLVLEEVTLSDSGNYTCRAINGQGSDEAHVRLVVEAEVIGLGEWR